MPILDDLASALEALTAHNEARVASIAAKSSPTASELALIDDNANYTHLALMRDHLEHEKSPDKAYQALQDAGETLEVDASLQEAAQLKDSESPHLLNAVTTVVFSRLPPPFSYHVVKPPSCRFSSVAPLALGARSS